MTAIARMNNIRDINRIGSGSYLTIPLRAGDSSTYAYAGSFHTNDSLGQIVEDGRRVYVVRTGDSLWKIARRFQIPLAELKAINSLGDAEIIVPGQRLYLDNIEPTRQQYLYVVRSGDTLWDIARLSGTEVSDIRSINGISHGAHIYPGQTLRLQPPGASQASELRMITHVVKRGETVWHIAQRYESCPEEIMRWNDLGKTARIYPGDRLSIWVPSTN
jgi:membrane-bound lytic murein transglycosylase D